MYQRRNLSQQVGVSWESSLTPAELIPCWTCVSVPSGCCLTNNGLYYSAGSWKFKIGVSGKLLKTCYLPITWLTYMSSHSRVTKTLLLSERTAYSARSLDRRPSLLTSAQWGFSVTVHVVVVWKGTLRPEHRTTKGRLGLRELLEVSEMMRSACFWCLVLSAMKASSRLWVAADG